MSKTAEMISPLFAGSAQFESPQIKMFHSLITTLSDSTRFWLKRTLLVAVFAGLSLSIQDASNGQEKTGETHVYKTIDDLGLKIHVTKPDDWKESDKRPAVVFFHGGAWVSGAPGQFTEHSKYLASRGMVAFQVEYRLLAKELSRPPIVCVRDAKSAMRWVRSRAKEFGIDPDRIASGGGSAGGHLAAFVGMVEGHDDPADDKSISPKSNAMLLFNPVYDNGPENGWGRKRVGDRFPEFSPAHNISSDDPPSIVFLGSEDKLIPVEVAKSFQKKMKDAGIQSELMIFDGKGHGFFNVKKNGGEDYRKTIQATDKFLVSLGWLKEK